MTSTSPPPPVSSLRSKFEQMATSSSASTSTSYNMPRALDKRRSAAELKQDTQDSPVNARRTPSSTPVQDMSPQVPILRPYSPSLDSTPGKIDTGSLHPFRGISRPISPQPPHRKSPSPDHLSQPAEQLKPQLSRRPPPPPPPPSTSISKQPMPPKAQQVDGGSPGGVASLRSKFKEYNASLGSGHPSTRTEPLPLRSISTTVVSPPALPARPGTQSPIKGPRASLPILKNETASPTQSLGSGSRDPSTNVSKDDLRIPPRLPSRKDAAGGPRQSDQHRCSSESGSGSDLGTISPSHHHPVAALRRIPPPPPQPSLLPLRQAESHGSDEVQAQPPPLPRRRSSDNYTPAPKTANPHQSPPAIPIATRPLLFPHDVASPPPPPPPLRTDTSFASSSRPGFNSIPPPPTRTVGLHDKVPAVRRRRSSDSSSDEEDEPQSATTTSRNHNIHDLPDSTHCSRRLPLSCIPAYRSGVPVPPGSVVIVGGSRVIVATNGNGGGGHELKIYDMTRGVLSGVTTVDFRDACRDAGAELLFNKKETRVTAMEFRAGWAGAGGSSNGKDADQEGEARFLWLGTKEGHLFEFDVVDHIVCRVRPLAHSQMVTRIMRQGRTMITIDASGKVLVWRDYEDLTGGQQQQPRVVRTSEKQGFVRIFGGVLWMSGGSGSNASSSLSSLSSLALSSGAGINGAVGTSAGASASGGLTKGPVIRVYDILATNTSSKMLTPTELLGAVTSGAVLPSQPGRVYLGHEGGFVSVWATTTTASDGGVFDSGRPAPTCIGTVKISNSDVLALEGVVDRLWAGSRGGVISAYSVAADSAADDQRTVNSETWRVTNSWKAHEDLPVLRIALDPFSIAKSQSLHVVSVGRDEVLRFWDGFLSAEWIESELQKHENEFSTFRPLNVLICSWNIDAQKPDTLTFGGSNGSNNPDNNTFLEQVLKSVEKPDIIAFGFQELIDLESRSLTAKTVLLGNQKKADGTISEKVSRSYRMWHDALVHAVRHAMPADDPFVVAHTGNLVGLFSCIFVRQKQKALLRDSHMKLVKRGMGGRYGNKGAIVARFVVDDSSLCFINCHLAAGQSHTRARNRDIAAILEDGAAFPRSEIADALPYAGGGDGSMILDHEICFLNGDLNYRIDLRRDVIIQAVENNDLEYPLKHDQLRKQAKNNPGFRLRSFTEAPITFAPTYKYDRRSDTYDSSEKKRAPAWCDRILWRCVSGHRVHSLHYKRYEVDVSDHRPISGAFCVTVKRVDLETRLRIKTDLKRICQEKERELLLEARTYYEGLGVL